MMPGRPRYRAQRHLLVRAVQHPGLPIPPCPTGTDSTSAGTRAWGVWLKETWSIPQVADAVRHASPALAHELDVLAANTPPPREAVRRLAPSLLSYTQRMQHRATPFGLFAGVTPGAFASRTHVSWGSGHRGIARADGAWLAEVIQQLEDIPEVRRSLPVVASNVLEVRGERLVLPWQPRHENITSTAVHEVSVRRTRAVRAAVQMASTPVAYQDLAQKLAVEVPEFELADAQAVLDVLISRRILLTSLQPPATEPDALGHVVAELERCAAARSGPAADRAARLGQIHTLMKEHNQLPVDNAREHRSTLTARMRQQADLSTPVALDLRLDAGLELPRAVAWEAERVAAVLARVSPEPRGTQAWQRYRARFRRRYGDGVMVPLREVLCPQTGLGLPEDFHGTARAPQPPAARRDAALLAHAQQAAAEGREIELDDALISELTVAEPTPDQVPPHTELLCEVHARSAQDLDDGHFTLALRRASRGWGHLTAGRFASALAADRASCDLLGALARRPTSVEGALPVQLSFPALRDSATHITRTPRLAAPLIPIAEHRRPDPDLIALDDLAVLCHGGRLHLVSRSRGQVLEAATPHPLQIECQTPTIARFLDELQRGQSSRLAAATGDLAPWDWGAARHLPIRPRVRYGRTVISPATWLLDRADLPGKDASTAQWRDAFTALRARWRLPQQVCCVYLDSRLRLDLDEPAHLDLLRAQVDRPHPYGPLTLTEAEPPGAFGWCAGRATEIVALLASNAPPRPAPGLAAVPTVTASGGESRPPGASAYLVIRLHGQPQTRHALITDHLPALLADLGQPPWWIAPHDQPSPHLLLTVRLPDPGAAAAALRHVGGWADDLVEGGAVGDLALVPYRPHLGRWGTGDLLTAAEHALATDSETVAHQLRHVRGLDPRVLTAANLVALATGFHDDAAAGLAWIAAQPKPPSTPRLPRDLVQQARALIAPEDGWPQLRAVPGGRTLLDEPWAQRHTALIAYAAALDRAGDDTHAALRALVDAHGDLTDGITPGTAETAWRLARDVALAATRRARHPHA